MNHEAVLNSEPERLSAVKNRSQVWAIGIYSGSSPFDLAPHPKIENPVLTCRDVSDIQARFLADPFMLRVENVWYMFFEIMNRQTGKGEIGLAISRDGLDWDYQRVVLSERIHLSYPYVFCWDGEYYMIPETYQAGSVRLYRAARFPDKWSYVKTLIGVPGLDSSIFQFDDRWWMFVCPVSCKHDLLWLYYADRPTGPWAAHPKNPIVRDNRRMARPAGRALVFDGNVIRYTQDCYPYYGTQVRAFNITEITTETYVEKEHESSPVLRAAPSGWNMGGMHHVDPHPLPDDGWIACVDGW